MRLGFFAAFLAVLCLFSPSQALYGRTSEGVPQVAAGTGGVKRGEKPIPPSTKVKSDLSSLEEAIPETYVSHAFPGSETFKVGDRPYVIAGEDIADVEGPSIKDFVDGTGDFAWAAEFSNSQKEIYFIRYHNTDSRILGNLAYAVKKKLAKIAYITFLNDALEGSGEFAKAKEKDDALGKAIVSLKKAGFKFNADKYGIFSPPLTGERDRVPLMHQKRGLFRRSRQEGRDYPRGRNRWNRQYRKLQNRRREGGRHALQPRAENHRSAGAPI